MLSNYHTHTIFCDGKNTPEELVQEALRLGCPELGFSGHAYTWFDQGYCMSPEMTKRYQANIRTMQDKYAGLLRIRLGVEQDYYAEGSTKDYEYSIGSVHYVYKGDRYLPVDESKATFQAIIRDVYQGDAYGFVEDYYATVSDVYEKTGCSIIGHFDLIMKFNETHDLFDPAHPRYQEAAEKAFRKLLEAPVRFEWNAGGMARGYRTEPYPAETFIERLCALGRPPIYASDCHDARFLLYGAELYEATVGSRC